MIMTLKHALNISSIYIGKVLFSSNIRMQEYGISIFVPLDIKTKESFHNDKLYRDKSKLNKPPTSRMIHLRPS